MFSTPIAPEVTRESLGLGVLDSPEFAGLSLDGDLTVGGSILPVVGGQFGLGQNIGSSSALFGGIYVDTVMNASKVQGSSLQVGSATKYLKWGDLAGDIAAYGNIVARPGQSVGFTYDMFGSVQSAGTISANNNMGDPHMRYRSSLHKFQNLAGTADGPVSMGTLTAYGDTELRSNLAIPFGNITLGSIIPSFNPYIQSINGAVDLRSASGVAVKNIAGSAAAPFSASTGAFSDTVTSGSFAFGFDASVGSMRVHQDAGYFVGSRGRVIAPSATTLHACANSGLKVRNYANTADAPITAGLITSNLNSSNTAAETLVDWQQSQSGGKKHFYVKNGSSNPAVVATMEIGINDAIGYGGKLIANVAGVSQCVGVGSSNATLFNATSTIMGIPGQLRMGASPAGYAGFAGDVHLVAAASGNLSVYQGDGTTLGNIQAAYHKGTHFGYLDGPTTGLYVQSNAAITYVQGTQTINYGSTLTTNLVDTKFNEAIGLWGVTPPAVQPSTPVTLADVITILQTYGLCA